MLICIDSCVFIRGFRFRQSDAAQLLELISPQLPVVVPRLVAQEVTRNLDLPEQVRSFHRLFYQRVYAFIDDQPVPEALVKEYIDRGLPGKADALIGAFAEWMKVNYLISDNRHFLRELKTDAYQVLTPADFLALWGQQDQT